MGYNGSEYERPELKWTQSSFIQPQMMIEDRYFYDPVAGKYTVDRYLDDLEKRYGGIDSVLIWHTYPNIGIDNRNQYDLLHDMPGGVEGLKQMINDFHRRGVRVLFPVMLWDQGRATWGFRIGKLPPGPWPKSGRMESTATRLTAFRAPSATPQTRRATPSRSSPRAAPPTRPSSGTT